MRRYELTPQYDSRASFYGKARVEEDELGVVIKLTSYTTHVATIYRDPHSLIGGDMALVFGVCSNTTSRHIKEFLKQHGFKADNMKQIMANYGTVAKAMKPERVEELKKVLDNESISYGEIAEIDAAARQLGVRQTEEMSVVDVLLEIEERVAR